MNYMQDIEKFFWEVLENEIQDDHQEEQFAKAMELLGLEDNNLANQKVANNLKLQSLFGFNSTNYLNVIEEYSPVESDSQQTDDTSDEEFVQQQTQTFRMFKQEAQGNENPSASASGTTKAPVQNESKSFWF